MKETKQAGRVLVVDDEADLRELLTLTLSRMGIDVAVAANVADARQALSRERFDLCLTDMRLPDGEGIELVGHIARHYPLVPVAVITAHGSMENAVASFKEGAFDYLAKPVSLAQLRALVRSVLNVPAAAPDEDLRLVGDSAPAQAVRQLIERLGRTQAPVHVTGESGSGKELAARMIHNGSARRAGAFVAVNCGALPEALMESEFFGHVKGAFTGADRDHDGFFQAANGGTLFLDEVADLPLALQVKLLRAIQEKKVRRVGSTREEPVDTRIISATHQDLAALVETKQFRQDLYYRLNVITLRMPSLREMPEDIPLIAQRYLDRLAALQQLPPPQLTEAAIAALVRYSFPGNVRELENILERAVALSADGRIGPDDLALERGIPAGSGAAPVAGEMWPLPEFLDRMERQALTAALEATRWNRTAAAEMLGITFRSLRYRLQRLGMD